jgi:DNA-directed RNA polymerase specialized sigma24 family protein
MPSEGSITRWIDLLKAGDHLAAQKLWENYFNRLVRVARQKLHGAARRAADEEDVALSAFDSFCRGAERGQFPQLLDRDDLWQLLVMITARKACDLVQHERRQKRGGGKVWGESELPGGLDADEPALAQIIGPEPTPAFAAQVAEEYQRLLDSLDDPDLKSIAVWKMEGYTNDEIATQLGRSRPTVERKLQLIRKMWTKEMEG